MKLLLASLGVEHTCTYPSLTHTQFKSKLFLKKEEEEGKESIVWWHLVFVLVKSILFCELLRPEIKETERTMWVSGLGIHQYLLGQH